MSPRWSRRPLPDSRIVAFSTGCVYPFVPVDGKGADESVAPNPPGEYAQSCVGRERMFEYFSRRFATPGRLFRLNYAIDMRYGVLHDIATKVVAGQADRRQPRPCQFHLAGRRLGAGAALPRALRHADLADQCQRPRDPRGARSRGQIRRAAWPRPDHRRQRSSRRPGSPIPRRRSKLFGLPIVDTERLIGWTADWVARAMPSLGKPTKYEVRDGRY